VFGIAQNPLGFPIVWWDRVRRALVLDRFPYALYFIVDDDEVTVIPASMAAATRVAGRSARESLCDANLCVRALPINNMAPVRRSA